MASELSTDMQGMTRRTLGGLFWTFLGSATRATLQVGVLAVLARLLTPADFGEVTAALVIAGLSLNFSQLGIGPAVVQRATLENRHLRTGFTASVLLGATAAILVWWAAPLTAALFRLPNLTPVVRAMAWLFPLQGLSVVAESMRQRQLRFRWLAGLDAVTFAIGYGVVGVGMAVMGFRYWAFVGALLTQATLRTAILLGAERLPMMPQLNRRALADLLFFGAGFTLAGICNYVAGQVDSVVVGRTLGALALGLYGRAYQLMAMPAVFIGDVLDKVLFPGLARVQGQPARLATAYKRAVALIALVMLPASVAMLILAPEIVRVVLGQKWSGVVLPFQIFALGALFRASYKISDALVRATGAVYRRAWRQAVFACLVFGGAWLGRWSLSGVAGGVLAAIAVNFFLMAHLSLSLTNLSWRQFWSAHGPALALAGALGIELWAVSAVLRGWGAPSIVVLILDLAAAGPTAVLLLWRLPGLFLGRDGYWMLRTLVTYIPIPAVRIVKLTPRWATEEEGSI